ncbi:MAG: hypothetical protein ACRBBW_21755 [Cellvibrionaceae bacterium]
MQVSNWIIFGAIEVLALLALICGFLLIHARSLKKLIGRLQDKLQGVNKDLKKSKQAYKEMEDSIPDAVSYPDILEHQLEVNREHHQSLDPDQDIALDLNPRSPMQRQLASLRHAFLITEKEAALSSETEDQPNWMVIEAKLSSLMAFFKAETSNDPAKDDSDSDEAEQEEIEQLKASLLDSQQRIENLEKFKTLFFELEDKWQKTQSNASQCHQELTDLAAQHSDQPAFEAALQRYQNHFNEFGDTLANNLTSDGGGITQVVNSPEVVSGDEIDRLKSVAANQHQLISELQQRLEIAYSGSDKDELLEDMKNQLQQHSRYIEESDTCIKLLERELDEAHEEISRLEQQAGNQAAIAKQSEKLSILLDEREMMNQTIQNLQSENEQLVLQMQATLSEPSANGGSPEILQELKQLQQQYTELESKYLELRMKA